LYKKIRLYLEDKKLERKISEEQEANWAKRNVYTTEFETFGNYQ